MYKFAVMLGIAGSLVAGSGALAAAADPSWNDCPKNSVCFYGQTDGDGRMVVVSDLHSEGDPADQDQVGVAQRPLPGEGDRAGPGRGRSG